MSPASSAPRGVLVVISGPSGAGKTTIAREIESRLGASFSVSATTRDKAASEVDGRDYFFLSPEAFQDRADAGGFLEYAQVYGRDWYGTPREPVERQLDEGKLVLLEIDVQGGIQVRKAMPDALMIFILPPSDDELLRRLRDRGRDSEEVIMRRYSEAKREIELARSSGAYDVFVVNKDLTRAIDDVCGHVYRRQRAMV